MTHLVIGLADGTVVGFRGLDSLLENASSNSNGVNGDGGNVGGLGKLRVIYEGKEPITGLGFRNSKSNTSSSRSSSIPSTMLFILTTSHVLSYSISSTSNNTNKVGIPSSSSSSLKATIIDELGAGVGCSTIMESKGGGEKLIVARDEAIYVYGDEGREGCYAYEGELTNSYSSVSLLFDYFLF